MTKVTTIQIYQLMLDVQEQMQAGFHDVRLEFKTEIQRLDLRMDNFETRLQAVRQTQLEDSQAITSVIMGHEKRITKLEKWRTKTAAA
ncbi:MAG: hypothetical protein Q7S64_00375 [bacterium]|nr:hypothetical protein [bacterium]